jgi:transposase
MPLVDTKVEVHYTNGGVRMERVPRAVYTKEFKEEAVKMVTEAGLSVPEVARRVSVSTSTIAYWVKMAKEGRLSNGGKQRPITEEQMELARLKRENAELKMERDILKKAAAYFAKESLRGTRS